MNNLAKKTLLKLLRRPSVSRILHRTILFAHENRDLGESLFSDHNRFLGYLVSQGGRTESQIFQDLWVVFETGGKRGGFFVEFGATDGRTISNTYLLERDYGWTGILAEPAPMWHDRLRANRTCRITDKCVWKTTGDILTFDMVPDTGYSTVSAFLQSDLHSSARRKSESINVNTITLSDLLDSHQAPSVIDFISLDTEGSELEILEAFDFSKRKVRLLCVEHNYTDAEGRLDAMLARNGFQRRFPEYSMFDGWYRNVSF